MELSEINIFPIKSLGGVSVPSAIVEERGLRHDRRWMLIDADGKFLTQRDFGKMATLKISIEENCLRVADGNDAISVPFEPTTGEKVKVKIWKSRCDAVLYDEKTNEWFAGALGAKCRLVKMHDQARRIVSPFYAVRKYEDTVSFADAYPYLLIGEGSLEELNRRLDEPVPMNRFRPNFVVAGAAAQAEESWRKIKIGETIFHNVKACARCVVTTIDQATGISSGVEPLRTLSQYRLERRDGKQKINFGRYLIAENAGATVKIGDAVEVLETITRKRLSKV